MLECYRFVSQRQRPFFLLLLSKAPEGITGCFHTADDDPCMRVLCVFVAARA